ncbi:MAG: discoidin domain-containing protein [Bacteroidales bacterium]|nr:discoidin domain-containing protein [Bacteroidales bacterium]
MKSTRVKKSVTTERHALKVRALFFLMLTAAAGLNAQVVSLDDFEDRVGWTYNISDGVIMDLSNEEGVTGNAIRIDYDFTKGTGYGGIQKLFPIDLPENYEFTFWLKAESPSNNFEIKFIDSTGNNVWWVNNRNYSFPGGWKKISIKKRHIQFAWGPTADRDLRRIDRIEFTVASFVGGKGTIWLDDLKFEPLPVEMHSWPAPAVSSSSQVRRHGPDQITDNSSDTYWKSRNAEPQCVAVDFKVRREFGGLRIEWLKGHQARSFSLFLSDDGKEWENVYHVALNRGDVSFVRLPEAEARYLRIDLEKPCGERGFGIAEITFPDIRSTMTPNDFLLYCAKNSPAGYYPRYFSEQASYWTVTGVNNDTKEALLNEDGMVEVDKALFSIEPMLRVGGTLFNWSNVNPVQSMGFPAPADDFTFLPSVTWQCGDIRFITGVSSAGTANESSLLCIGYGFENLSDEPVDFDFYLLIRPFQVNPYYQFLNTVGGRGTIDSISEGEEGTITVDEKVILSTLKYDYFGTSSFDEGNIVDLISKGELPESKETTDRAGMASGVMRYTMHLDAGGQAGFFTAVPYHGKESSIGEDASEKIPEMFYSGAEYWKERTGHVHFNLPASADRIVNTWRANLAYILINRDNAGIQPGSRSYERSWIRDGAMTSSALLKSGIVQEVRDFANCYAGYQYEDGKVPCVVDFRGPDPVPENDSHGELIYLIREYFNFTGDTLFLRSKNQNVLKAVDYIESLLAERSTDHFRNGNDSVRAYYGLMPESISHEGYSAKPMHSYWDDFFTMKGLKDAAEIQSILGETANYERIARLRDTFRTNLYNSLDLAMKVRDIDYIPGCVELGDFDATSTTIALTPCNELNNLPEPQARNTFEKYYRFFSERRNGQIEWVNYTPYENRLIGSFIMLDQPERAHELIEFFLGDQRPPAGGWYHWAEVVWREYRHPGFIGDMPHTWCGSDFINAVRSMFVYENEYDQTLVLAAALYQDWIDAPEGMSVENLPTYYGEVSYAIRKDGGKYLFSISGDIKLPEGGIIIKNFNGGKVAAGVTVNGMESTDFSAGEIRIREVPAEVVIYY